MLSWVIQNSLSYRKPFHRQSDLVQFSVLGVVLKIIKEIRFFLLRKSPYRNSRSGEDGTFSVLFIGHCLWQFSAGLACCLISSQHSSFYLIYQNRWWRPQAECRYEETKNIFLGGGSPRITPIKIFQNFSGRTIKKKEKLFIFQFFKLPINNDWNVTNCLWQAKKPISA